jgi:hypothetical protein
MSAQISGLGSSRDRSLRCFLIACSLLVGIILILVSIKVSAATVWSGVAPYKVTINSERKGDRLPLVPPPDPKGKPQIEVNVSGLSVLPDGCEALASPLARSAVAHIAGRCVS